MEKEESSSNGESEDEYGMDKTKSDDFSEEEYELRSNTSSNHNFGKSNYSSGKVDRLPVLPPAGSEGSLGDDRVIKKKQTEQGAEKPKISTKSKRPRILPPEPSSSDEDDETKGNENNGNSIGVINFRTQRMRKLSQNDGNFQPKRSRFYVRINDDTRSRSPSPLRKVIIDRPLDYAKYTRKCRNYEELGFCLAGNNCPYSHGPNTIVVNDVPKVMLPSYLAGNNGGVLGHPGILSTQPNPSVPVSGVPFTGVGQLPLQQSLHPKPQQAVMKRRPTCSLLLRKIPPHCANIAKINEYFCRFGDVQHIQVNFGGKPDEALIKYSDVESAVRAYRCQEPIFSNRFVNLRWYDDNDQNDPLTASTTNPQMPTPANSFGIFSTIPTTGTAPHMQQGQPIIGHPRSLSKTYGIAPSPAPTSTNMPPLNASGHPVTSSSAGVLPTANDVAATTSMLQAAVRQSRDCTALRPLSKRFTARTDQSLNLKTEQERLLGAKTDIYLKLSEQLRIVLLNAKSSADATTRQRWMKMVDELQMNMDEVGESIRQLFTVVYPGRRPLDLGSLVGSSGRRGSNLTDGNAYGNEIESQTVMRQLCQ